jgi:hypothetical protein
MTNTLIQKMACGESVFLTPQKDYVFKGQHFKSLNDCYEFENKEVKSKALLIPRYKDTWAIERIKEIKENEKKSKKV